MLRRSSGPEYIDLHEACNEKHGTNTGGGSNSCARKACVAQICHSNEEENKTETKQEQSNKIKLLDLVPS